MDSCLGANGAIYAIRGELFPDDIPDNTVVDDFVVGMKVREQGYRFVYEPEAVAEERLPEETNEWGRRVRIGAGDFQALRLCRQCLLPRFGRLAWMFWSHKVLRWLTPYLALVLTVAAGVGAGMGGTPMAFRVGVGVLGGMAGVMLCALVGGARWAPGMLRACRYFVVMQAALFVGSLVFFRGGLRGHWDRTPRG